jgi:hypothetical protein
MSDPQPRGPTPGRNPWVTALLILIGIILLLPGLCSLVFSIAMFGDPGGYGDDPGILSLMIFCFLIGAGGIALIVFAIRRHRSPPAVQ